MNMKQYTGLDIGKFLCALLILFYHYFSEHGPLPSIIDEALSLYAVAVALFMSISGFLIFDKIKKIETTEQRWFVVKKQALRILKIYAIWSIPYIVFTIIHWDWATLSASFIFWQIQGWIFKQTFYTIWFMPSLAIGLILIFWLNEKIPATMVNILAIAMYFIGSLGLTYSYFGKMIPGFSAILQFIDLWLGGARGWLCFAFPLLCLGKCMVSLKNRIRLTWWKMALGACISVTLMLIEALILRHIAGHTGIDMTLMMIPSVFCVLGFLLSINLEGGSYCIWMRKMSTLIFMSQRIFLTVIPVCMPAIAAIVFKNNMIGAVVVCGSVIIASWLIIILSQRFTMLQNLY